MLAGRRYQVLPGCLQIFCWVYWCDPTALICIEYTCQHKYCQILGHAALLTVWALLWVRQTLHLLIICASMHAMINMIICSVPLLSSMNGPFTCCRHLLYGEWDYDEFRENKLQKYLTMCKLSTIRLAPHCKLLCHESCMNMQHEHADLLNSLLHNGNLIGTSCQALINAKLHDGQAIVALGTHARATSLRDTCNATLLNPLANLTVLVGIWLSERLDSHFKARIVMLLGSSLVHRWFVQSSPPGKCQTNLQVRHHCHGIHACCLPTGEVHWPARMRPSLNLALDDRQTWSADIYNLHFEAASLPLSAPVFVAKMMYFPQL